MVARLLVALSVMTFFAAPAGAGSPVAFPSSEFALLAGAGISHPGFGDTRTEVQTADLVLRYGRFLSGETGSGWYRGRHEILLELPFHLAVNKGNRSMAGGYLLGSWKFTSCGDLVPYAFAGGGPLFVDLGLPTMSRRLDFSYQGGIGLQRVVAPGTAIMAEYRYHHVSNAGTGEPNEPINSSKILLGISFFR
jgi:lipid A 3-O-deacylase